MGLRACQNDVLIVYGDLVFNEHALATIYLNDSSILFGEDIMGEREVGCILNKKNAIENMMYDLPTKWGQIAFFRGRELKILKEICWNPDNYNMFGFEAINNVVANGGKMLGCTDKKAKIIDIDTNKDLERISTVL